MKILLMLGAVITMAACQHSEDRTVRREIQSSELIGTWTITPDGIRDLRDVGHKSVLSTTDHVIALNADGTCTFRGFLNPSNPEDPEPAAFGTGCTWRVSNFSKYPEVWVGIKSDQKSQTYFNIFEDKGRLLLWQYVDDPDAWNYLELAKTSG